MTADGDERSGGGAFFTLAVVILAGLLFAAGVMVGRNLAVSPCPDAGGPLARADAPAPGNTQAERHLSAPSLLLGQAPRTVPVAPLAPRPNPPETPLPDAGWDATGPDAGGPTAPARRYAVQVAAFKEAAQAQALAERLSSRGYPEVRVFEAAPGRGAAYRVRTGTFAERDSADALARRLEAEEKFKVLVVIEE